MYMFLWKKFVRQFGTWRYLAANMLNQFSDMVSAVREIIRRGMSVNLYMFHGGSTFGFMSGALADPSYKALVPSYGWFLCALSQTNQLRLLCK